MMYSRDTANDSGEKNDITYKDCTLLLLRDDQGKEVWRLDITFRHEKGKPGVTNIFSVWEQKPLLLCPIALFITLAIADEAFRAVKSLTELKKVKIPEHLKSLELGFTESAHRLPVFRGVDNTGQVKETGWQTKAQQEYLRRLSICAGFPDIVRPYSIRRHVGNELEG